MDINLFSLIGPKRCYIQTYPISFFFCVMEKLLIFFRCEICSGVYKVLVKRAVQLNWSAKKGGHLTTFKLEQPTTKILEQNSNSHKSVELLAKSISDFGNFGRHFPCATSAQIFAKSKRLCGRRWRNLFHIMGTAPKVEMARGCGLRTRLWLLIINNYWMRFLWYP